MVTPESLKYQLFWMTFGSVNQLPILLKFFLEKKPCYALVFSILSCLQRFTAYAKMDGFSLTWLIRNEVETTAYLNLSN